MSWKMLAKAAEQFNARQDAARELAEILMSHPEWIEQEPQLKELIEKSELLKAENK
jgi:predicted Zn-dependent protease